VDELQDKLREVGRACNKVEWWLGMKPQIKLQTPLGEVSSTSSNIISHK